MEVILALVVGLSLGAAVATLICWRKMAGQAAQVERLNGQIEGLNGQIGNEKARWEETKRDIEEHFRSSLEERERSHRALVEEKERAYQTALEARDRSHRESLSAQQVQFDEMMKKVEAQMKVATDEMLKQRQKEFSESSNANLGQLLNPLRETMDQMKQAMTDSTLKQAEIGSEMRTNVENMMRQSEQVRSSADKLHNMFSRGNLRAQGDWGEMVLSELLESQGLTEGRHYDIQYVLRDADGHAVRSEQGKEMRPDVVLHLDRQREVIIDSKVSLAAYMDYANAATEEERQRHLKTHIENLKAQVRELAKKDYSSYIQPPKVKMGYVIMFVPHSGALWTAMREQPDLWRWAMSQNVFIADEQTLFAALRLISLTWTQIAQEENHRKVYALAEEMLSRVGKFLASYKTIGEALEKAEKAYHDGEKKLTTGQSVVTTCNKLVKLGAKSPKRKSGEDMFPMADEETMLENLHENASEGEQNDTIGNNIIS